MMRVAILATTLAVTLILLSGGFAVAADSGCVKCHTDAATLKALFIPPTGPASSEGEG
jgi:hypothetical protein